MKAHIVNLTAKITTLSLFTCICFVMIAGEATAQRRFREIPNPSVSIEYVHYRPVSYETEKVIERQNERKNEGGLVFVYLKNISDNKIGFRNWYLNRKESIEFRLSGDIAWDRLHPEKLAPGEMGVLEISGISEDFASDKPFEFAVIDKSWRPAGAIRTTLKRDPIEMTFVRVLPGMKEVQVHISNSGEKDLQILDAEVVGSKVVNR